MNDEIKKAIEVLVKKIITDTDVDAGDALKLTQAALNLAHAQAVLFANKAT